MQRSAAAAQATSSPSSAEWSVGPQGPLPSAGSLTHLLPEALRSRNMRKRLLLLGRCSVAESCSRFLVDTSVLQSAQFSKVRIRTPGLHLQKHCQLFNTRFSHVAKNDISTSACLAAHASSVERRVLLKKGASQPVKSRHLQQMRPSAAARLRDTS